MADLAVMNEYMLMLIPIIYTIMQVKYYAVFLIPKGNKNQIVKLGIGFGMIHVIYWYVFEMVKINFGFDPSMIRLLFRILFVFLYTYLFFYRNVKMQLFLLCSSFAVLEISMVFISSIITSNLNMFLINGIINYTAIIDSLEAVEKMMFYIILMENLVRTILYTLVTGMIFHHMEKSFRYKRYHFSVTELLYLLLPCLSGFFFASLLKIILKNIYGNQDYYPMYTEYMAFITLVTSMILLISLVITIKLFQRTIDLRVEESESAVLRKQMNQLHDQIQSMDRIYTEIKGMRHDMKSHFINMKCLAATVQEGNQEVGKELTEYLGLLGDSLSQFDIAFQTGSSIIDIILHQTYLAAKKEGIDFTADFIYPTHLKIDIYDLAVILNNGLENAREACLFLPIKERFIRAYSYVKGNLFFIEIENSFMGDIIINPDNELPISGKLDSNMHGMGLSNIRRCARKHYGEIDIQIVSKDPVNIFQLMVMLQRSECD